MKAVRNMSGGILAMALMAAQAAWADCRCDDGTVFRGGNGECKDGGICHLIAEQVTRFQAEEVKPFRAEGAKPSRGPEAKPAPLAQAARPNVASLCGKLPQGGLPQFLYRCDDGTIRDDNDCADGSMGHLFNAQAVTCKKHDAQNPNRIALAEFFGTWNTWVPGVAYSVDDHVNDVRINHVATGSAPVRDLVINANGTYTWKGKHGTWRETNNDADRIVLIKAMDGHDWNVSVLENWYGYLAISDATNNGIYYYGKR